MRSSSHRRRPLPLVAIVALSSGVMACALDGREARRVDVELHADELLVTAATSELGWDVSLERCRAIVEDVAFTTSGTMHARSGILDVLWQRAWAHPGHQAGGEVIGEAPGRIVADLCGGDGSMLAAATLLEGEYNGANFSWTRAGLDDVAQDDELVGHSMVVVGVATREDVVVPFEAFVDQDEGRAVVGAQFDAEVSASFDGRVVFSFVPHLALRDASTHVFDGIDFDTLPQVDGVARIEVGTPAHNLLRNALQKHDFFVFRAQDPT